MQVVNDWSQHGKDVISKCKCIIYTNADLNEKQRVIVSENDPRFEKLKAWSQATLFAWLYHWWWIQNPAFELPSQWIAFYSVEEPRDTEKEGLEIIHFSPETLGLSKAEVEKQIKDLNAILDESKTTPEIKSNEGS